MAAHLALHRRQRLEMGEQVAHVGHAHALVRAIWERRIIMLAAGAGALGHRGHELRLAPRPDAVLGIGRDVGHVERAERRLEAETAAEPRLVILSRDGVARGAASGIEHRPAVGGVRRVGAELACRHGRRDGEEPEGGEPDGHREHRQDDQLANHRSLRPPNAPPPTPTNDHGPCSVSTRTDHRPILVRCRVAGKPKGGDRLRSPPLPERDRSVISDVIAARLRAQRLFGN